MTRLTITIHAHGEAGVSKHANASVQALQLLGLLKAERDHAVIKLAVETDGSTCNCEEFLSDGIMHTLALSLPMLVKALKDNVDVETKISGLPEVDPNAAKRN